MGLHPFNLITADGGAGRRADHRAPRSPSGTARARRRGAATASRWMSCLRARVGDAEAALRLTSTSTRRPSSCATASTPTATRRSRATRTSPTGRSRSKATSSPMHAVHEMLLQSWSATPGTRDTEVIRLFPATSARWKDASFDDLRAEGGYRVSARRENGATTWFRVKASRDGIAAHPRQLRRPRAILGRRRRAEGRRGLRGVPEGRRPDRSPHRPDRPLTGSTARGRMPALSQALRRLPRDFPKGKLSPSAEIWDPQRNLPDRIRAQRVPWPWKHSSPHLIRQAAASAPSTRAGPAHVPMTAWHNAPSTS